MSKNISLTQISQYLAFTQTLLDTTSQILSDDNWIQRLLDWSNKNIIQDKTLFPVDKNDFQKIIKINLRWNRLISIPAELCNLKQLKILELNNNNLTGLPKEIAKLEGLEELNLNINNLTTLPKEIIQLGKLKVLNIKNNKYLELSAEQIVWLEHLVANGCTVKYDKYKFNIGE